MAGPYEFPRALYQEGLHKAGVDQVTSAIVDWQTCLIGFQTRSGKLTTFRLPEQAK